MDRAWFSKGQLCTLTSDKGLPLFIKKPHLWHDLQMEPSNATLPDESWYRNREWWKMSWSVVSTRENICALNFDASLATTHDICLCEWRSRIILVYCWLEGHISIITAYCSWWRFNKILILRQPLQYALNIQFKNNKLRKNSSASIVALWKRKGALM